MSIPTRDEFFECIRRSGLVEEERLVRFLQDGSVQSADVLELAKKFVEVNLLTDWQKDRLLEKKWKGFFLGKYKILFPLGAGAMGSVFLAEHKVMRHRVALKVLAKRLVSKPNNVARFEREARAAAVVNHPNVVRAFDIDRDGETHYLVMEYVQGDNLQKMVQDNGPLDPFLAAEYVSQIGRGLNEAHKNGMIHRDIKPSNVLLDPTGLVKILDLGLARIQDDDAPSLTIINDSKMIGTVDYLAPEQALNSHTIDGRADIYSLGCTLYYLLTGMPPFPSGSLTERILKHQTRRPMDIRKRRPGVPDELVNICSRMMEKQPGRRYQKAGDASDALTAFCEGRLDELALDESQRNAEDSDSGGLNSLAEDSSTGRSGIMSKSMLAGRSRSTSRSIGAAGKSTSTSKIQPNSVTDDLDLTPVESPSKKSAGGSLITGGSGSLNSPLPLELEAGLLDPQAGLVAAAKPGLAPLAKTSGGLLALEEMPAALGPSAEQSMFDQAIAIGDPLGGPDLASLGSQPALLEVMSTDTLQAIETQPNPLDAVAKAAPATPAPTTPSPSTHAMGGTAVVTKPATTIMAFLFGEPSEDGEFNYPLWFLILSGLLLSLVLFVIGYSFFRSF